MSLPVITVELGEIKTQLIEYFNLNGTLDLNLVDDIVERLYDNITEQIDVQLMLVESMKEVLINKGVIN